MYVGVFSLIVGQGLFPGDPRVLVYGILVWLGFHTFVLIYEEPTLRRTVGAEYERFYASVPRWIPPAYSGARRDKYPNWTRSEHLICL
jgi:protein-S-isoprenylcysteine O-methyltransferase Ste14